LQLANASLLSERNDAHWRCEDLENDLKKHKADSAARIVALESNVKFAKTHCAEVSTASDKRLIDLEAELTSDLMELQKLYIHNIRGIGGLCSPMPEGHPSATDYICWVFKEVADLPKVFAGVNENFVSATVEGALLMADDSIDLDAVVDAAATSSANILPEGGMYGGPHAWWQINGGIPLVTTMCWVPSTLSFVR
jgi:hypothetical protein